MQFEVSRRLVVLGAGATCASMALGSGPTLSAEPLKALTATGGGSVDHSSFDGLVGRFVKPDGAGYNRVDYKRFKQGGHQELKSYLGDMQNVKPAQLSRKEGQAYWINLYNAKTLDIVLDAYPVTSIKQIKLGSGSFFGLFGGGPWSKQIISVDGTDLSLDDIEHRIVRPLFGDAMSHYGLNCASYSCPNLATKAYTGKNISGLLAKGATDYVNHKRGVSVDSGTITASKIYSWYASDFGGARNLKSHWQQFAAGEKRDQIATARIGGYEYDWSINDI